MHVGEAIAQSLEAHHVSHVFMVPGESFLAVLDGMHAVSYTHLTLPTKRIV